MCNVNEHGREQLNLELIYFNFRRNCLIPHFVIVFIKK